MMHGQKNIKRKLMFHQNLRRITGTLHADQYTFLIISRRILLRMRNVWDQICRENRNPLLCSVTFSRKSCRLWNNVEKCGGRELATDDNAHWMLVKKGYRHTHTHTHTHTCNMYYRLSTATTVARTLLNDHVWSRVRAVVTVISRYPTLIRVWKRVW